MDVLARAVLAYDLRWRRLVSCAARIPYVFNV
jgi:hypothetical protein